MRDCSVAAACGRVAPLAIEDLERLAESAHILGRGADAVELLQRVYEARVRDGATGRAVRTAFYLWHALVAKGEFARRRLDRPCLAARRARAGLRRARGAGEPRLADDRGR